MSRRGIVATAGYFILYTGVYAGWLFHRSNPAWLLGYSKGYLLFLAVAALPYVVPAVVARAARRADRGRLALSAAWLAALLLGVYMAGAAWYGRTQQHPFDPFLQVAPPPLDVTVPKQPGEIRILCLGGSTTKCGELRPDQRYPAVLEAILREQLPGRRVTVFNAGQDWYTTEHSLISYCTGYSAWHPDVVVILHAINDLCRSFSPPDYAIGPYNDRWSHFYGAAIHGAKPPTFGRHLLYRLQSLERSWYSTLRFREIDVPAETFRSIAPFKTNLERLVHYGRADGAIVILVTQPSIYRPDPTLQEKEFLYFAREYCNAPRAFGGCEFPSSGSMAQAMNAFNDAVRAVAREDRVALADAAVRVPKSLEYLVDDVHYTGRGARLVAQSVADTVGPILSK